MTCSAGSTQRCGDIDNCGQTLHCGDCPADLQCNKQNVCVGTNCVAGCTFAGGAYCGVIGDNCGGTLDCGAVCPQPGWTCGADHICKGDPTVCQADTCVATSGDHYCGTIGDGCGNTLDCGNDCPTGWSCINNLCVGSGVCNAVNCATDSGDHYCGTIGDGCGGSLDCGDDCPAGWTCDDHVCKATPPICTLASCTSGSGDYYCGTIGDGCGGSLDCGADCPAGWTCVNSVCVGAPPTCVPATCDAPGGGRYCGQVGDGCGGTLDCPTDCPQPGWVCQDNLCIGPPDVCTKITCVTTTGDHYCGTVGDNCGGSLDCGNDCPAGWTCGPDQICKGGAGVCTQLSCTTLSGDHYCGTVGDGCGGSLACSNDCPAGWTCGTDNICKGGTGVCTPATCDAPNGDRYCGTIGDQCGGTLDCGTTCPEPGWTCNNSICQGGSICTPLTCVASSGDNYCGAIGDGCGGTLDCSATCPQTGWVCDSGLCRAGPTADCVPRTCTTADGAQYCGTIGDGCGNSLDCGSTCAKTGWVCQDNLCKAGPTANCVPLACTTAGNDQYCGTIGDGCGNALDCGTTCANPGWTCQNNLCIGPPGVCTPLTCTTGSGAQYCGTIGDGCGNSLDCGTTCTNAGWTCQNNLCKGGSTCVPVTCTPASGGQYCGTIGDGCGNSLVCSTDCSAAGSGWACGSSNVCMGGPNCVQVTCNDASGAQQYCGNIGDGCGGTLSCPATCPAGMTCGATMANVCGTCVNLCQSQVHCDGGATTSISGTVYDPAGLNPLYNVIVAIPNAALDPIPAGASCTSCDAQVSGQPIATALTDSNGHFILNNVPWGTDFPVVMQLGKWRRQVTIPASMVTHQCADNPIVDNPPDAGTLLDRLLRLPRNIYDGDNNGQYTNMPKIAITTGQIDALECLLTRAGIDTAEFTNPEGTGHINLYSLLATSADNGATQYAGPGGATFPVATTLFDSVATEQTYDIIIVNCAGADFLGIGDGQYVTEARRQNLKAYVNGGGKAFLEHYFASFLMSTSTLAAPYGEVATWDGTLGTPVAGADLMT
ncbi:MAG: carboxypeptidase-like regulatory domain-containing protein, partial [Polyangia bacterium]